MDDVYRCEGSYRAFAEELADFCEARESAAVIGDVEGEVFGFEGFDHLYAFAVVHGHRFFDITGFAGFGDLQGVFAVCGGGRGDVHGVDVGMMDDFVGVAGGLGYAVAFGEVRGFFSVPAHDNDEF